MKTFSAFLIAVLVIVPNAFAGEETPQQGVQSIINLYKNASSVKYVGGFRHG